MESLLIITGSMGSGKSAVLAETSDILGARGLSHAAIDLDALGIAHLPNSAANDSVMYRNLGSICRNYESIGVTRFLLARAMEERAELNRCCDAVSVARIVVCRLTASIRTMQQRVESRELGLRRREFIDRVAILDAILDRARLENFVVVNENRSLNDVAHEMLQTAHWISD